MRFLGISCVLLAVALGPAAASDSAPVPVSQAEPAPIPKALSESDAQPKAKPWALTAEEIAAITALADEAVKLGLPDAKGAEFWEGSVQVETKTRQGSSSSGEHGQHLKLADGSWLINMRRRVVPTDTVSVKPQADARILTPQQLADPDFGNGNQPRRSMAAMKANLPPGYLDKMVQAFVEADRPRIKAMLDDPAASRFMRGNMGDGDIRPLLLIRAGIADAIAQAHPGAVPVDESKVAFGVWGGGQARRPLILDASDQQFHWRMPQKRIPGSMATIDGPEPGSMRLVPLAENLRKALLGWFLEAFADPAASGLTPDRLAAAVQALQPANGPIEQKRNLERLLAGFALPDTVADGADLATRLTVWRTRTTGQGRFEDSDHQEQWFESMDPDQLKHLGEDQRRQYEAYQARRKSDFTAKDLDGLIALAGDTRPTRWIDGGRYQGAPVGRTVGDNALRAVRRILGVDPRLLIGRDIATPWTDSERTATATALAEWWKTKTGKTVAEILSSELGRIPFDVAVGILAKEDDKAVLAQGLAALAPVLAQAKPDDLDPAALGGLLRLAGDDAGITAVVAKWPIDGVHHLLLATWHDRNGRPASFDALLTEALTAPAKKAEAKPAQPGQATPPARAMSMVRYNGMDEEQTRRQLILTVALRRPHPERLVKIQTAISGGLDQPLVQNLLSGLFQNQGNLHLFEQGLNALLDGSQNQGRRIRWNTAERKLEETKREAMALALVATLLGDQRTFPKGLVTMDQPAGEPALSKTIEKERRRMQTPGQIKFGSTTLWLQQMEGVKAPTAVRDDWRVCDFTAATACQQLQWRLNLYQQRQAFALDLNAEPAARDRKLDGIRRLITRPLNQRLKEAGLPELAAPSPSPAVKDEDSLF